MTDILEYTLSLNDQFSSKLQKIGITSDTTLGIFAKLEKQANDVKRVMKATGGSVGALRMKLEHLKRERDWLPQSSINTIRKYNTEIKKLTKQITKLETINGSKAKTWFKDAFNQVPFGGLLTNPLVMGGLAAGKAIKLGIQDEMQKTSFEVLLNSESAAKKMMKDIKQYASKTPYKKIGLGENAKMMLSFGIKQDDVMPYLKSIGDIAMGDSNKMQSLTLAFSQMSSTGKLMGQDLLQMINAGFNPLAEISRKTGKSIGELKEEMAKGKISAQMVQDAFISVTQEGGKFYNMSEKMSKTIGGRLSTALDKVNDVFLALFTTIEPIVSLGLDLGITILGFIAPGIEYVVGLIREGNPVMMTLIGIVGILTTAYYAEAIALKVKSGWLKVTELWTKRSLITQKLKAVWDRIVAGTTLIWAGAQGVLNAVMEANPIGLIIVAVAALTAGIIWLVSKIEGWGEAWQHTIKGAKLTLKAFVLAGKLYYLSLFNAFMLGLDKMKIAWYKFKNAVGLGDEKENDAMIKKINADMEKRKKAVKEAYSKLKKATVEAGKEFSQAYNSLHWKDEDEKDVKAGGIAKPKIPGVVNNLTGGQKAVQSKKGSQTNKNIATGGRKTQYITINLKSLVEMIKVSGRDYKESAQKMERETAEAFLRVLAMAATSGD